MGKPDMAAEARLVKASMTQAIGRLTGDPALEAQGRDAVTREKPRKRVAPKAKAGKAGGP